MSDEIRFAHLDQRFQEETYPVPRGELESEYADTTVVFADGEANLGDLIGDIDQERFVSAEDLTAALQNVVPVEAVGEPGQSDGDA